MAGWNRRTRWAKAYIAEDARGRGIEVIGENSFPLGPGIHQELLEYFIGATMVAGCEMLAELTCAVDTPGTDPENWVRETR